jgi:hypothetical protein
MTRHWNTFWGISEHLNSNYFRMDTIVCPHKLFIKHVNNGNSNHNYLSSLYTMVVIHEAGDANPLEVTLETNTEHTLPVFHCPSLQFLNSTAYSYESLYWNIQGRCLVYLSNTNNLCLWKLDSFNVFKLSCSTSNIIFNLLKVVSVW